jgi:hypothetical protein
MPFEGLPPLAACPSGATTVAMDAPQAVPEPRKGGIFKRGVLAALRRGENVTPLVEASAPEGLVEMEVYLPEAVVTGVQWRC